MKVYNYSMFDSKYSPITLSQIHIFLVTAKYENFRKASEELHMIQSTVSRNIAALEEELGIVLFVRHNQRVRLTEAGKQLEKDLKSIVRRFDSSVENAMDVQRCETNVLRVLDCDITDSRKYLLPDIENFSAQYPEVELNIDKADLQRLVDEVSHGTCDAAFFPIAAYDWVQSMGLKMYPLKHTFPQIVICRQHEKFGEDDLAPSDFSDDTLIAFNDGVFSTYWNQVVKIMDSVGFAPKNVKYVSSPNAMALELQMGHGFALMDELYMPVEAGSIRYIPVGYDRKMWGVGLICSPENENIYLSKFAEICKKTMNA